MHLCLKTTCPGQSESFEELLAAAGEVQVWRPAKRRDWEQQWRLLERIFYVGKMFSLLSLLAQLVAALSYHKIVGLLLFLFLAAPVQVSAKVLTFSTRGVESKALLVIFSSCHGVIIVHLAWYASSRESRRSQLYWMQQRSDWRCILATPPSLERRTHPVVLYVSLRPFSHARE